MKKVLTAAGPLFLALFLSQPALAGVNLSHQSTAASPTGHGAVVLKDASCLIPVPEPGTITTQSHATVTPSGNTTLTCHSEVARRGQTFSGRVDELCTTPGGAVTSGHVVVTRSGEVNLACHLHPRSGAATVHASAAHGEGVEHRWQHGAVAGTGPTGVGRKLGRSRV